MRRIIETDEAPQAVGTYSQGIRTDGLVFTSGQIAIDPKSGGMVDGEFADEVEQVMQNLGAVLRGGGSSLEAVVKFTVYLTDLEDFATLNEVFSRHYAQDPPARSAVQVSALPLGARVEIEAVGAVV